MYAFTMKRENKGILVFRFDKPDAAIDVMQAKKFNIIDSVDLYERLEK
jgi:hypothetical protein